MAVVKSIFSPTIVEEIRHGCKNLQRSLINNSKFIWNIPVSYLVHLFKWRVDLGVWEVAYFVPFGVIENRVTKLTTSILMEILIILFVLVDQFYLYIIVIRKGKMSGNTGRTVDIFAYIKTEQKIATFARRCPVKITLRLFQPLYVVITMVPRLMRKFRRSLKTRQSIANAVCVL